MNWDNYIFKNITRRHYKDWFNLILKEQGREAAEEFKERVRRVKDD
jgi:hypothetical protein